MFECFLQRKRVGFSDPVSSTKEYLLDDDEVQKSRSLSRQLIYTQDDDDEENKENENDIKPIETDIEIELKEEAVEQPALMDHDYDETSQQQSADITTSDDSPLQVDEDKLVFNNKDELLDYVTKNLSIDELFGKLSQAEQESIKRKELITKMAKAVSFEELLVEYFPKNESPNTNKQNAQISLLIAELTKLTKSNTSAKHKVLAAMSTTHKEDFLGLALQDNSTSAICDMISVPKVIRYLIHKINTSEADEHSNAVTFLNRAMVKHLLSSTYDANDDIFPDQKEVHELMNLLFKSKPKVQIFDITHEYLRNLVEN